MSLRLPSQDFAQWRDSARRALSLGVAPKRFDWQVPDLCMGEEALAVPSAMVPGNFLSFARQVALHQSEERWSLLYSLLWRLHHGEPAILENESDPEMARALFMYKAVDRDMMKMKVFVRFQDTHDLRVAWYKPEHFITEDLASYFVKRDPDHVWMLHTPHLTVRWNLRDVELSAGLANAPRFLIDDHEDVWLRYYHAQFNPARERIRLAGSDIVGDVRNVVERPKRQADPPESTQLGRLRTAAKSCLVCPFARNSTQTVFGEGAKRASLMFVGEQPGDYEDRSGRPFVGPAGELINELLEELGISRDEIYVTNAVKHFKFTWRGKRRIHAKPNGSEILACRPWLEKEIAAVQPQVILALGATAAASLTGRVVKITKERGTWLETEFGSKVMVSWHPSAILRSIDEASRAEKREQLKQDIRRAWSAVKRVRSMRAVESRPHL